MCRCPSRSLNVKCPMFTVPDHYQLFLGSFQETIFTSFLNEEIFSILCSTFTKVMTYAASMLAALWDSTLFTLITKCIGNCNYIVLDFFKAKKQTKHRYKICWTASHLSCRWAWRLVVLYETVTWCSPAPSPPSLPALMTSSAWPPSPRATSTSVAPTAVSPLVSYHLPFCVMSSPLWRVHNVWFIIISHPTVNTERTDSTEQTSHSSHIFLKFSLGHFWFWIESAHWILFGLVVVKNMKLLFLHVAPVPVSRHWFEALFLF